MNQTERILEMMENLSKKQTLCIQDLSLHFETSTRTIQRDMKLLKAFFKEKLYQPKPECYILQDTDNLYSFIKNSAKPDNLKSFFEFMALFDDKLLSFFDQKEFPMIKEIRRESKVIYHILEKPIEELKNPFLGQMKEAISMRRYVDVTLTEIDPKNLKMIKPLKIVFAEGNWYLAAITKNYQVNYGFKFFRINFITDFKLHAQTFQREIEAQNFIENFQSLFQNYKTPNYEVTLCIDSVVSRYFKVKKHLKSQKIIKTEPNGDIVITYQINNDMEILPMIKKWLPHIKVISPKSLDDKIKDDLRHYLS